jgi:chromosomal replication initiation ATPase DnaA
LPVRHQGGVAARRGGVCPRQMLDWHFKDGLSTAQVAARAGLKPGQARTKMVKKLTFDIGVLTGRLGELLAELPHSSRRLTVDHIVQVVAQELGFTVADITPSGKMKIRWDEEKLSPRVQARKIAIYLAHKLMKLSYRSLVVHFSVGESSIGLTIRNLDRQYNTDREFRGVVDQIEEKCSAGVRR